MVQFNTVTRAIIECQIIQNNNADIRFHEYTFFYHDPLFLRLKQTEENKTIGHLH